MFLRLLLFFFAACALSSRGAELPWTLSFDPRATALPGEGAGELDHRENRAALCISRAEPAGSSLRTISVPIEAVRGKWVSLQAEVKAEAISRKPEDWNGIKVMLKVETPNGDEWPQLTLPAGTFAWTSFSTRIFVPPDATAATLHLGLEKVTGTAWFDNIRITLVREHTEVPPAPAGQPIFKGHSTSGLRGAMVHPEMTQEDLRIFAEEWGGNLIRCQLLYLPPKGAEQDFGAYDLWLDRALKKLDEVIVWARKYGVKVVVDLHSPPGGNVGGGWVATASGDFWKSPAAQRHFLDVWRKIATRYREESETIWGFDLLNEPDDRTVSAACDDWQSLAGQAAQVIREIHPDRTLIVEPNSWGSAEGFRGFRPLDLPNVVYSFHMYTPFAFTHQGVDGPAPALRYPGPIEGKPWDRQALQESLAPAIAFTKRYRVHLYVGEFSAIRWAPGAETYLSDLITLFESQGWDWTYHSYREWHGWNLELGTDRNDQTSRPDSNARRDAIIEGLKKNHDSNIP